MTWNHSRDALACSSPSPSLPRCRSRAWRRAAHALALLAAACGSPSPDAPAPDVPRLYSDVSGAGPFNGVEWQIDAPWRMEPDPASAVTYDKLPVVVTFHDMDMQGAEEGEPGRHYGRVCGLYVMEEGGGPVTFVPAEEFHEIEASKRWLPNGVLTPGPDNHVVRRLWAGESADGVLGLDGWSEWHATVLLDIQPEAAGDVHLVTMAEVSEGGVCHAPSEPILDEVVLWQQMLGRFAEHRTSPSYTFTDFLSVHYAAEPMPRFSDDWVYGDLHYHSQGTDNEGESAINFRGVIQAMKGMGMDYVFATDHASDSAQITGIDTVFVNDLPFIPDFLSFVEDWLLENYPIGIPLTETSALRDLNLARFQHLYGWLNDPGGVNAQVGSSGGSSRRPQIFLGAELDVVPEVSDFEAQAGFFVYAHDQVYNFADACHEVPEPLVAMFDFEEGDCVDDLLLPGSRVGQQSVLDVQGPGLLRMARQHLLHLPSVGADNFISGNTLEFGGASEAFITALDELRDDDKGYMFLAHPVEAAAGSSVARLGPDIIPYSDVQLQTAFAREEVLGLQVWNSDARYKTSAPAAGDNPFPFMHKEGQPDPEIPGFVAGVSFDWGWDQQDETHLWRDLSYGSRMWDQVLRWGITPARVATVEFELDGPRKMFMSGGSDAHGDLNYRRQGRFFGWAGANDTAIGKPRNLTDVGSERGGEGGAITQTQVLDALRSGRFSVTDGPALRIAIDVNDNGVIDDEDVPMGGDFVVTGATVPLLVEWKSTPEFGPVREIDLYVGAQAGDHEGVVWAPAGHGPAGGAPCVESDLPFTDSTGREYCPMQDGYARDLGGNLTLALPLGDPDGYAGTERFDLALEDFPVFDHACSYEYEEIWNDYEWETIEFIDCDVDDVQTAERLYTRAFARTEGQGAFLRRYAFSNPIWMTAEQVASPPTIDVRHVGCDDATNTFTTSVTPGAVSGTITRQRKIGNAGSWVPLTSDDFTATSGQSVFVRAQACNAHGCSAWAEDWSAGPTCLADPPSAPSVHLEWTQCSYGTNHYVAAVSSTDPATASLVKQFRVGSGSWRTLSSPAITAGSSQTVRVRAQACNDDGVCSGFTQRSNSGPYCPVGGGGDDGPINPL